MTAYFTLGTDISKARTHLANNLKILESEAFSQFVQRKFQSEVFESSNEENDVLTAWPTKIVTDQIEQMWGLLAGILKRQMTHAIARINKNPSRIQLIDLLLIEFIYAFENDNFPDHIGYLSKLLSQRVIPNIRSLILVVLRSERDTPFGILRYWAEEKQDDPHYPTFFAFTLRQTSIFQLSAFLEQKQRFYRGDFLTFLEYILLDDQFSSLLSEGQRVFCENWIEEKRFETKKEDETAARTKKPPKGWVMIPRTRINQKEIRRFFSFLYEYEFPNGQTFLTKKEFDALLEYGFGYSTLDAPPTFTLRFSKPFSKSAIDYMIYHLYEACLPSFPEIDFKNHFALFLKKNFTNYSELDLNAVRTGIRNRRPERLPKSFDPANYLPSNH